MLLWYTVTIFVSAFLLFLVQPMVGKMVLPLYGGTPAVWNACMVFFQAVLLSGYVYTHLSIKWFGLRRQTILHVILLFIPLLVLPILISYDASPPADSNPVLWLLYKLFIRVGLPFFVVSASAPLLQRWFVSLGHPSSKDPYFLYAASNAGSFIALLGYPILFEPLFGLTDQSRAWTMGYGAMTAMILMCGIAVWRSRSGEEYQNKNVETGGAVQKSVHLSTGQRFFWIFTSFVPSSLMLSVTAYITTNIAAIPLLWILPLALYLLTFVLVFSRKRLIPGRLMAKILPFIIIPFAPFFFMSIRLGESFLIPLHLFMFFVAAMVCHGELANRRPAAEHLTEYYLWMSVGGVLGGLFNSLIAPFIFSRIIEYPLAMFLVCFLLPRLQPAQDGPKQRMLDFMLPLSLAGFMAIFISGINLFGVEPDLILFAMFFAPSALVCFGFKERPLRFALAFGIILILLGQFVDLTTGKQLYISRNFFGVKRVVVNVEGDMRVLYHGTTVHGAQFIDTARQNEPLTYFHRKGPLGDVFDAYDGMKPDVAVIGLGAGSIASYSMPGQHFVFYEIDPDVEQIARNDQFFRFLSDAKGKYDIVLGDGRLTMGNAPDNGYGIIILDAFSSDAIPVHLLTREAVKLYLSKLDKDGIIVFHISNRFLDLEPLLGNIAKELSMECLINNDVDIETDEIGHKRASRYLVMGRSGRIINRLYNYSSWQSVSANPDIPIWTDKYSNVMGLFQL